MFSWVEQWGMISGFYWDSSVNSSLVNKNPRTSINTSELEKPNLLKGQMYDLGNWWIYFLFAKRIPWFVHALSSKIKKWELSVYIRDIDKLWSFVVLSLRKLFPLND